MKINLLFFINGMHFDIVYHNLDNYNVCAKNMMGNNDVMTSQYLQSY